MDLYAPKFRAKDLQFQKSVDLNPTQILFSWVRSGVGLKKWYPYVPAGHSLDSIFFKKRKEKKRHDYCPISEFFTEEHGWDTFVIFQIYSSTVEDLNIGARCNANSKIKKQR